MTNQKHPDNKMQKETNNIIKKDLNELKEILKKR